MPEASGALRGFADRVMIDENDGVFEREIGIGPDPRIEQIVHAVAGLTKQVGELADQVEELRKRAGG